MEKNFKNLFGLIKEKTVPVIEPITEVTRDGLPKAYIPKFLYKPPFGYPRFVDLPTIRRLASMPYVDMCISATVDEMSSIKWDIIPEEGTELDETIQKEADHVKSFYNNPNTNKESFEEIRRKYLRDILEIDAGVINKIFNLNEEMVEMVARDGATFTKNPDIFGFYTDRVDLIIDTQIVMPGGKEARLMEPGWITAADAREKAAYFQYGWISGARPVPFGKNEIVWFERNPRTDSIYGRSPVEILATTIQTLIYAIENDLEYFNDNSIPKGIIGLEGLDAEGLKAFREQWKEQQRKKDTAGNWKKTHHQIPIVGTMPKFERLQFSNAELELIEGQKWWSKMVWACFGVTSVELGYTEDAKGLANQIVQSNIFRKRAINPLLRLEEYKHNHEIIPEFYIIEKKKFIQQEIIDQTGRLKLKGKITQKGLEEIELKAIEKADEKEKNKEFPYQKIRFKFLTFDVEEETKKASLYKIQLDAGYKSINEIRAEEGLDEVEWGEKQSQEEMLEMQNKFSQPEAQEENRFKKETDKTDKDKKKDETKDIETKPLHTHENPLILREFETMNDDRLERSIVYLMKENEKKIKELMKQEIGKNKLMDIKSLDDIAKRIKSLVNFHKGLKTISDAVIKHNFMIGWDSAEKQLDRNFMVNREAIDYIQEYTFNNIKSMTEEITTDLRQELERGIMSGEGITKLTERVSKVFNKGENRAEMIARTETNRAENQGKLQAFKSSGERYNKKYLAVVDERTSPICKRLHNQIVGMDDNFKDNQTGWEGPVPPAHVNCRSSVVFTLKEEPDKKEIEEAEKEIKEKEETEKKAIDEKIKVKLIEKDMDIQNRKDALLKRLEDDNGGNKDI